MGNIPPSVVYHVRSSLLQEKEHTSRNLVRPSTKINERGITGLGGCTGSAGFFYDGEQCRVDCERDWS